MAAEGLQPSRGSGLHLPDLRIVLLGNREAGKSLVGNTILGREEFDPDVTTPQCVKRQAEVAGRQVMVVDTPGWNDYDVQWGKDSPNLLKQELVLSVTLCPPGPHCFLLVIHDSMTFTEAERYAMSNHLSLLGHGVWGHSLVLFIQETPAETFEVKDKIHKWLVEKCGNRYHVLNIKNRDRLQVRKLLEKIDIMVAGNSNNHYEINREIVEDVERKNREIKERAVQRKLMASQKQATETSNLSEIRMVLLGSDNTGKSSSGNSILGREEFQPGRRSTVCVKRQGDIAGRHVTVVDTPGWWSHHELWYSPEMIKQAIQLSPGLCDEGPHVFLLVVRVDMSFAEHQRSSAQQHLELLGAEVWSHTMVLFTHGDWLGDIPIEEYIESEEAALKGLIARCGNRYHLFNNHNSTDDRQVTELLEKVEDMVAKSRIQHFKVNRQELMDLEKKMRMDEIRAEERMIKMKKLYGLRSPQGQLPSHSEFRIVLLGYRWSGKTSSGNTILGREEFDLKRTAQCVKRQGEVAGRHLNIVDTPGWWMNINLKDTPELTKQEIMLSVSLHNPGPHIFLLHVSVADAATPEGIDIMLEHVNHLCEGVWSHTMVLFTHGDRLGDTPIELHIESEGALQSLVEKCGNRYHVLNNMDKSDRKQITELLEKIEEIICGNGCRHYEMDRKRLEEVMKRREEDEERAIARLMAVEEQRQYLQSLKRQFPSQSELRIVLLGNMGSGKSYSGNTILGREEFDLKRTAQCVKRRGEVAGRQLTVVEAPGWWKNINLKDTPELIKQEILLSVAMCPPGPHIFLLHVDVTDALTTENIDIMVEHVNHLGEEVWSHTMVLFTNGAWLGDTPIELYIESEGALQPLVEICGNRYHVLNNMDNGDRKQITELLEKMEDIICGNWGCHYEMDMKRLEEVMKRREEDEERATARLMKEEEQRQHLQSLKRQLPLQNEFRIVLLGCRASGKSSSGNTILGREEFELKRTAHCVKREGEVAGRQLTVVEAPGWWPKESLKATTELTKQEIVLSMSSCPPGPHIFLLHLCLAYTVTPEDIANMMEHVDHLSEGIWSHTMVLFTWGDWLGDTPIELYIEREGALKALVEKCGNRYHALSNEKIDDWQVLELLDKIEEVVAGNRGQHFEVDMSNVLEIEKKRRHLTRRAEDRETSFHKQSNTIQYVMGDWQPLSEVRILSLQYYDLSSSHTNNEMISEGVTFWSAIQQNCIRDRDITTVVVYMYPSTHTLQDTKEEFLSTLSLCDPGPHAISLEVNIELHFSEERRRRLQTLVELLGHRVWDHVMVVFVSYEDQFSYTRIEEYIEMEGEPLQWLVEKCGNRYICRTNESMSEELKMIGEMMLLNGGRYFQYEEGRANQTTAAAADWKMEVRQIVELKEEDELAQRMKTSLKLEEDDNTSGTHGTHISDKASEHNSEIGSSVKSDSGYVPSRGKSVISGLSVARSTMGPPETGGDDLSEVSSVYSRDISDMMSEAPSEQDWGVSGLQSTVEPPMNEEEDEDPGLWGAALPLMSILEETNSSTGTFQHQHDRPTNSCKSCEDIEDSSDWTPVTPAISIATGGRVYSHSSPPGSFECTVSGLRWVCVRDVSLQYHFSVPNIFREELAMLQYSPIGPLMNIKVLSGELLEAHLPHFACLDGSDAALNEAVSVLHSVDGGVHLESCELTRFHAKLMNPSFSLIGVLVKIGIPMKTHLEVLTYRTRVTPLVLLTYVVPRDASMIQAVEEEIKTDSPHARKVVNPRPDMSIWFYTKCSLKASTNAARITPPALTMEYTSRPYFFKVVIDIHKVSSSFDLELVSDEQSIWKATLDRYEMEEMPDSPKMCVAASAHSGEVIDGEEAKSTNSATGGREQEWKMGTQATKAASGHSEKVINKEVSMTTTATRTTKEEGKLSLMSNKECLDLIKRDLTKKISKTVLEDLMAELEAQSVINSGEAEEILQRSSVVRDQVTSLMNALLRKGERACGIMFSLLRELDRFLYEDLGL